MEKEKCNYYGECNAPLCPLDQESIEYGIWYSDESVCRRRLGLPWVKRQQQLVKKGADPELYFDVKMLNTRALKGKDPDKGLRRASVA